MLQWELDPTDDELTRTRTGTPPTSSPTKYGVLGKDALYTGEAATVHRDPW